MSKRLSEELKDAVVSDYLSGVTTREIYKKHKTYKLYSILKERGIEYKQNNDMQKEKYSKVIELYLKGEKIKDIERITGSKNTAIILKKFNIKRNRDPKEYNSNKKEDRNKKIIEEYLSCKISVTDLVKKYNMSFVNLYRILDQYNVPRHKTKNHHWVIHQRVKNNPNMKCKFYILENYFGYTKVGITTKNKIKERFGKKVNVFFELEGTLDFCYNLEYKMKKQLRTYIPKNIDKKIDGWSECYTLHPSEIVSQINCIAG